MSENLNRKNVYFKNINTKNFSKHIYSSLKEQLHPSSLIVSIRFDYADKKAVVQFNYALNNKEHTKQLFKLLIRESKVMLKKVDEAYEKENIQDFCGGNKNESGDKM